MSRRMEAGEQIPEPRVQIPKLHVPTDNYTALENIKHLKKMLAKDIKDVHMEPSTWCGKL